MKPIRPLDARDVPAATFSGSSSHRVAYHGDRISNSVVKADLSTAAIMGFRNGRKGAGR